MYFIFILFWYLRLYIYLFIKFTASKYESIVVWVNTFNSCYSPVISCTCNRSSFIIGFELNIQHSITYKIIFGSWVHGADPSQGLPLEQFNTLKRLKAKEYMRNLNVLNLLKPVDTQNEPRKIVSVPHQFGSNSMSAKKTKEDMEKFSKGKWVFPIDIAAILGNIEIVKILLSKLVVRYIFIN